MRMAIFEQQPDCTCDPDRLLDGKGHSVGCPWITTMLGEVVNSAGKPTGIRRQDALAMLDFLARVENSDEIMKMSGPSKDPWVAINAFLDLFDSPHNASELWVWSKFRWVFGRENQSSSTWKADDTLDELLGLVRKLSALAIKHSNVPRVRWLQRKRIERSVESATFAVLQRLGTMARNFEQWPDAIGFQQFKGH